MESISIPFRQFSYPVMLMKMLTKFLVHHSSFFFFSGGTNSSFRCWSYSFPYFNVFLIPLHLIIIHLLLFNCSGVLKKSRRFMLTLCFRSSSFKDVISFKPFKFNRCNLSLKSFYGVSFQWALTHRSFPRILPDSSYSLGIILKSSKVWRKNELSSVKCLSPRSFISFHHWFNFSILHSFSSPVDSIQALVLSIVFYFAQCSSYAGAPLNHSLLVIHLFRSAEDISEDSCFHSTFIQDLSRLLSHSSHLNSTGAFSLLNRSTEFLLSGP